MINLKSQYLFPVPAMTIRYIARNTNKYDLPGNPGRSLCIIIKMGVERK